MAAPVLGKYDGRPMMSLVMLSCSEQTANWDSINPVLFRGGCGRGKKNVGEDNKVN